MNKGRQFQKITKFRLLSERDLLINVLCERARFSRKDAAQYAFVLSRAKVTVENLHFLTEERLDQFAKEFTEDIQKLGFVRNEFEKATQVKLQSYDVFRFDR